MAANQAKEVTVKKVAVVPSKTVPQGLSAMLSLHPDGELNSVAEKMMKALEHVRTGEITTATRSVEIDGVKVETGQVIALLDGKLVAAASSVEEGCLGLLEKANASDHELITLFYGQDTSHAEANRIADVIRKKYASQEVEAHEGGQPHFQFIISVE